MNSENWINLPNGSLLPWINQQNPLILTKFYENIFRTNVLIDLGKKNVVRNIFQLQTSNFGIKVCLK